MAELNRSEVALGIVRELQGHFVSGLEGVAAVAGSEIIFKKAEWLRDGGKCGGGDRFFSAGNAVFNRASVNVSHIDYGSLPEKPLASATAISTIIHPDNPHAPSVHIHISWTEMKNGKGYWRIMADLNPAIVKEQDKVAFEAAVAGALGSYSSEAAEQGEKYFYIPALGRHRGVVHFYLEGFQTEDFRSDSELALTAGKAAMDSYLAILRAVVQSDVRIAVSDQDAQLAYHTLYLLQVLTLDRGTTSGLLVHDQNDLGIMGSLPGRIDKGLLASWESTMEAPQDALLKSLLGAIPESGEVTDDARAHLAQAVRAHYQKFPEALKMQASGNVIPPTVKNHA